jgi:hypothetical protein
VVLGGFEEMTTAQARAAAELPGIPVKEGRNAR